MVKLKDVPTSIYSGGRSSRSKSQTLSGQSGSIVRVIDVSASIPQTSLDEGDRAQLEAGDYSTLT